MFQKYIFTFICLAFFAFSSANKMLTIGIKQCRYTDGDCLSNSIQLALKGYAKSGIKELDLVPLDPLHIKKLRLAKNEKSPVSIDLSFTEVDLNGLSTAEIKRAGGLTQDLKSPLEIELFIPKVTLKGPYSIDGKLLILPIVGKGIAQVSLENLRLHVKVKISAVTKPDGVYAEVTAMQLSMEPSRVYFKLEGLFNGQRDVSDNMHLFINENWSDIFNELKPDLSKALSLIFKQILNNVFAKHTIDSLFVNK